MRRVDLELPPQLEGVLGRGKDGIDILWARGLIREAEPDVVEHHDAKVLFEKTVASGVVVARSGETVDEDDGLGAVAATPTLSVEHLVAVGDLDVAAAALPITQICRTVIFSDK